MTNEQLFTEIMIEFTKLNARLDKIEKTVDSPYRVVSMPPSVRHIDLGSFSEQFESSFTTVSQKPLQIKTLKDVFTDDREEARKLFANIVPSDVMGINPGVDKLN